MCILPLKGKIATRGELAVMSQNAYHKALRTLYPALFQIIEGYFILEAGGMPRYQNPLVKTDRVNVWRLEEKKTDVNIALNLYRDAYKGVEQLVLVSNDSDISRHWKRYRKIFRKSEPPRHHAAYETR